MYGVAYLSLTLALLSLRCSQFHRHSWNVDRWWKKMGTFSFMLRGSAAVFSTLMVVFSLSCFWWDWNLCRDFFCFFPSIASCQTSLKTFNKTVCVICPVVVLCTFASKFQLYVLACSHILNLYCMLVKNQCSRKKKRLNSSQTDIRDKVQIFNSGSAWLCFLFNFFFFF